jgi:hypothetical protein
MKLRLRAHTIRLRLLQDEVARLALGETIRETLPTPRPFHFAVAPTAVPELTAHFADDTLRVEVPAPWAASWAASDEVGRQAQTQGLDILIEKDWACTTARAGEENKGTYPNPTAL